MCHKNTIKATLIKITHKLTCQTKSNGYTIGSIIKKHEFNLIGRRLQEKKCKTYFQLLFNMLTIIGRT